ncbi:MAG: thiol reductant ABC exporter subunit CydC [Methylococcales bacterium]
MKDLWFFLKLFKPHRFYLGAGVVLSLLTAFASISLLTLSGCFISSSALAGTAISFNFMLPAAQIRALAITRTLGRYGERLLTHEATFRVLASIRSWFFFQIIPLVPGRLATLRSGDLLSNMTADIDALDALYLRLLAPALVAAFGVTAVVGFLYLYSPLISLTTGTLLLIAVLVIPWLFNRLGVAGAEAIVSLAASFRIRQIDMIQGLSDLLANQAYSRFSRVLAQLSSTMIDTQRHNNRLSALSSALTLLLSQITLLAALVLAAISYQDDHLSGAELALIIFCVIATFELVTPLPQAMQMLAKTQKSASRIRQVAELSPSVIQSKQPLSIPNSYDLQLENVSFRYSGNLDWVLKNINLNIPQGAKLAIIGVSGSGKTTLLQLLMRYFDPELGAIYLNGHNLKQFNSDDLLLNFGVLSQRSQLFAATIKENLLIAKPNATMLELNVAIKLAGLEKLISYLPEGIDTWVGESGLKVSGGEARRIALARLYLKDAPVLILDEPTEGLDSETEQEIFSSLAKFAQNKTLIMVTHKESGLSLVDFIYRMELGVLIEMGAV